ncbi:MAG TPA: hypothetical protein VII03_00625 [Solirubrobacteraceae bacterium]
MRLVALAVAAALAVSIYLTAFGAGTSRSFEMGIVSNADPTVVAAKIGRLGVPIARVEFPISASPARLAPVIAAFARRHVSVLPLAGFPGRIPTSAEARNLASWARAFGPSGTYWAHHPGGSLAIRDIEFGNETNQAYQFGCGPGCSSFAERGHAYALAVKQAAEALAGVSGNPGVGVLAIADNGGTGSAEWVNAMFDAVPDLASRVAGWTAHPYGPRGHWQTLLDQLVAETNARGAPLSVPIYITELGIASDNGRCLENNFGWDPCMSYAETGVALASTVSAIRARYGTRIRAIFVYQALDQRLPHVDSNREHYFGILTANGAAKGALTATFRSLVRSER